MQQPNNDRAQPRGGSAPRPALPGARCAFTMIELLVVIGIISVLIALLVIVGGRVAGTGKQAATMSTIKALDAALGAVIQERGRLPRAVVRDPRSGSTGEYWPIADAWYDPIPPAAGDPSKLINSAGWFLQLASQSAGAADLSGMDPELLRTYTPADQPPTSPNVAQPQITTPMDAWGNPIRFVHPDFDGNMRDVDPRDVLGDAPNNGVYISGVTITRIGAVDSASELNLLNADGGFCPGNQPYFYSAGPDGRAGAQVNIDGEAVEDFNTDNIYSAKPEFDREQP